MGAIVQKLLFKDNVYDKASTLALNETSNDIREIPIENIDGEKLKLGDLMKGFKLTIIVNVASK